MKIKKHMVSTDNLITSLVEIALVKGTNPVEVLWDYTIFGRNSDIPLYIYMIDVLEIVVGNQKLNITIIQFFMM